MSFYRNKRKAKVEDDFIDDDDAEEALSSEDERATKKPKSKKPRDVTRSMKANVKPLASRVDPEAGITACMISNKRKVVVRQFKRMILIDIREYYGQGDDLKPGKKGISLSLDQWKLLRQNISKVDEAIEEMS